MTDMAEKLENIRAIIPDELRKIGWEDEAMTVESLVDYINAEKAVIDNKTALIAAQGVLIKELEVLLVMFRDALEGVVRVADRKTIEFDAARAALASVYRHRRHN